MTRRATSRRQVVRRLQREELAGLALIALAAVVASFGLAGQLTALVTGHGWPSWRGHSLSPALNVLAHPADPMRGWPDIPGPETPPAFLFWSLAGVLLALLAVLAVLATRLIRRHRAAPGFASRRDVERRLGEAVVVKQAPRLRPHLVRTTPRPTADQVGTFRGRDVHTGVDCYSTVRQSTYVVGPSESGKTSCVVIPEALDHDGPLLAPSSRAEVIAATWKARAERGRVLLFDPLQQAPALPLLRWDPVRDCTDPTVAMRRAQALMSSVDMM